MCWAKALGFSGNESRIRRYLKVLIPRIALVVSPARLTGATLGGSFSMMHRIYVGFQMEINVNGQWIITSPVKSIGIGL